MISSMQDLRWAKPFSLLEQFVRLKVVSYLLLLALKLSILAQLPVREAHMLNPSSKQTFRSQMGTLEWYSLFRCLTARSVKTTVCQ